MIPRERKSRSIQIWRTRIRTLQEMEELKRIAVQKLRYLDS